MTQQNMPIWNSLSVHINMLSKEPSQHKATNEIARNISDQAPTQNGAIDATAQIKSTYTLFIGLFKLPPELWSNIITQLINFNKLKYLTAVYTIRPILPQIGDDYYVCLASYRREIWVWYTLYKELGSKVPCNRHLKRVWYEEIYRGFRGWTGKLDESIDAVMSARGVRRFRERFPEDRRKNYQAK